MEDLGSMRDRWLAAPDDAPHHLDCPEYYRAGAGCRCAELDEADAVLAAEAKTDAQREGA